MSRRKAPLSPIVLTTSLQTVYTVPSGLNAKDISFDMLNDDTANAIGVTTHFVLSGGTAAAGNKVTTEASPNGLILYPNEWRPVAMDQALDAGGFIQMKASITGKVNVHITVNEYVP
jgi:hypothetical protein